jgi:hypothetical protein
VESNIFRVYMLNPQDVCTRSFALNSPLKNRILAMERMVEEEQRAEATKACRAMLSGLNTKHKAYRYVRNQMIPLDIEEKFAKGDWVSIQPNADLAGWRIVSGRWHVDKQGGLIGKTHASWQAPNDVRGMMLLREAKVGTRFEITGHAEILEPEAAGGSYGAVIAYRNIKNYWECHFTPSWASVRCSLHGNSHARSVATARSADFRVQVYDGQVATTVGEETKRDVAPAITQMEHDWPSDTTPMGIGAFRPFFGKPLVAVRFTNLKMRKMSKPPATITVPVPE